MNAINFFTPNSMNISLVVSNLDSLSDTATDVFRVIGSNRGASTQTFYDEHNFSITNICFLIQFFLNLSSQKRCC